MADKVALRYLGSSGVFVDPATDLTWYKNGPAHVVSAEDAARLERLTRYDQFERVPAEDKAAEDKAAADAAAAEAALVERAKKTKTKAASAGEE